MFLNSQKNDLPKIVMSLIFSFSRGFFDDFSLLIFQLKTSKNDLPNTLYLPNFLSETNPLASVTRTYLLLENVFTDSKIEQKPNISLQKKPILYSSFRSESKTLGNAM